MKNIKLNIALVTLGFSLGLGVANFSWPAQKSEEGRITGIGGVFFKTPNSAETKDWYKKHFGFNTGDYGTVFEWRHSDTPDLKGHTQWSPFTESTNYFEDEYMINYRVDNLEALLKKLRAENVTIVDSMETYEYGKFVHIRDLNGLKVELWEPLSMDFDKFTGGAVTK